MKLILRRVRKNAKLKIFKLLSAKVPRKKLRSHGNSISPQEKASVQAFLNLIKEEKSVIFYGEKASELYVKSEDSNIYMSMDNGKLKIFNSVFAYDIMLSENSTFYIMENFKQEMAKRQRKFKKEITIKLQNSLENYVNGQIK